MRFCDSCINWCKMCPKFKDRWKLMRTNMDRQNAKHW